MDGLLARRRFIWWTATVLLIIHVVFVVPVGLLVAVQRSNDTARDQRRALCIQSQANRQATLDLIDFATQPVDTSKMEADNHRTDVLVANAQAADFRLYAHTRLPPIDC